jgi:esterase
MIAPPAFRRPAVEGRISIAPDLTLHYLDWPGEGVPVLFLHGSKSNARAWDFVVDASALGDRRFIAPDQRGHGLSEAPTTGYQIENLASDMWAFLDALSIERAVVVGTATGGYMALTMASSRPERVAGIAVVDAGIWINPNLNFAPRKRVYDSMTAGRAALDRSDLWDEAAKDHYALHSFRDLGDGRVEYRHFEQPETAESRAAFDVEALKIGCPTLLVRGEHSDITEPDTHARLAGFIPQAEIATVAGSGHHVSLDKPAGLAAILDRFIAGLD